ncbi:primosomal protein N' [Thermosynechococcus sp.]|uniref:primosomal protein N' n=1 Tax=Thermosynechococcus sp. TaxID=2814275 RepID=UPI00391D110D
MVAQSPTYASVLVDCVGAADAYTYRIPDNWAVQGGDVVEVPFGAQVVRGIVLAVQEERPPTVAPEQVRSLLEIVDQQLFPKAYWALLEQMATYYCTPLIQVVRTALPPGVLGRSQRRVRLRPHQGLPPLSEQGQHLLRFLQSKGRGDYSVRYLQQRFANLGRALRELERLGVVETYLAAPTRQQVKQQQAVVLLRSEGEGLTQRQRQILHYLRQQDRDCWLQEVLKATGSGASTLRRLAEKGYLAIVAQPSYRLAQGVEVAADAPKTLTPAQTAALGAISEQFERAQTFLLHGVTGSGKTEVYLQAIARCLERGRSALLLVPEIALTPQLTDRVRARFGDRLLVYHSGLSDGERYDTWRLTLQPEPRVVIGTRSAILLPLVGLGLIILDEAHDSSYKQDSPQPCYDARTLAEWRSHQQFCPLVLGTATPSLDIWQRTFGKAGNIRYLPLPQRIHGAPLPPITVVDMREEFRRGNRSMLSRFLQEALADLKGQQAILFVPRRGHNTFVACRSCGTALYCPHCSVSLTVHLFDEQQTTNVLRCHYCGYQQAFPERCPKCDSPYLKPFGGGTQRVVAELNRRFPQLRVLRFDSDTTRGKEGHRQLLKQFVAGEADVMVGTQMLTKGIDIPEVALVGILAADSLLHLPQYHAGERAFQLLTQVAGRCGRGEAPGRVILQTYVPEHSVIQAVKRYDWEGFAATEQQQRQLLGYPPYGRLILLRLSDPDADSLAATAMAIADRLRTLAPVGEGRWEVLGPIEAVIHKIADRYRWQIILKGNVENDVAELSKALVQLKEQCPRSTYLSIDVDPLNFL